MLKSSINKEEIPAFPLLAQHKKLEFIILFINVCTGTVVHVGESKYELGEFSDEWVSCFDEDFKIFNKNETVTITQE